MPEFLLESEQTSSYKIENAYFDENQNWYQKIVQRPDKGKVPR